MKRKSIWKMIAGSLCGASLVLGLAACGSAGPKGEDGKNGNDGNPGVGIADVVINDNNELVITLTNGQVKNLGDITGEKGDKGDKGDTGESLLDFYSPKVLEGMVNAAANGYSVKDMYTAAQSFGYKGTFKEWSLATIKDELAPQYPVTVSDDYTTFTYGWDSKGVTLGEKAILLDNRFTDEEVAAHDYIFNDVTEAIAYASAGTEADPMVIYMAPGVYWTHDPNSEGTTNAYTITKTCANMHWEGLTDDYRNVVIAFNYGHNQGYSGGNPTCFNIGGDGFNLRNLTVGGYCNIDLNFALNTDFSQPKRTTDVTQCQLGSYSGDKLYAENVAFISRLNMMPFNNSKRALYVDCHLESTDDSLNGSAKAVYLNCEFEFYASKPWGGSSGATLLNCDFDIVHINVGDNPSQYFTKMAGRVNAIDCRFHDSTNEQTYNIGWSDILSSTFRSYYSNVTYNGVQTDFSDGGKNADKGVDLTGKTALSAYKIVKNNGATVYNVYNLLRGTDDWDPLGQKAVIVGAGATDVPTTMSANTNKATIETGKEDGDTATISFGITGPQNTNYKNNADITWSVKDADKVYVELTKNVDGTCTVKAINEQEETVKVVVEGTDVSGLKAAVELTVKPSILPIAAATAGTITQNENGTATVAYTIADLGTRADQSRIKWYIADDAEGTNQFQVAEGRGTTPLKTITLQKAWAGKYLIAVVESKHIRSNYGEPATFASSAVIAEAGIKDLNTYHVELDSLVTANQAEFKAGFWTARSVAYGTGAKNGFLNYTGIYFTGAKTAYSEIDYTPIAGEYGDMKATLKVAPGKTAGQGFGSNNNFIEVRVKYDGATDTGYAVRIVRTSGDSTKVQLVKLAGKDAETGVRNVEVLAESGNTSVYLTECTIEIWTANGKLNTKITTSAEQPGTAKDKEYLHSVELSADITASTAGGFGAYYESSTGDNTTYIGDIQLEWTK